MSAETVAVARRWFEEVWNQRRVETIHELLAADSVVHGDIGVLTGPDEFYDRQYVPFLAAFPDIRVEVEDAIGQGDQVVVRWSAAGTHTGDGLGFPATGRPVRFRGMTWIRARGGRLGDGWQWSDIPQVLRGLATPA